MEMRYRCGFCGQSTTNPTSIDWCEQCKRLVCRDCSGSHESSHREPHK